MKYKLLVLDVDGTLLDSEKKISKRTLAALLKEGSVLVDSSSFSSRVNELSFS